MSNTQNCCDNQAANINSCYLFIVLGGVFSPFHFSTVLLGKRPKPAHKWLKKNPDPNLWWQKLIWISQIRHICCCICLMICFSHGNCWYSNYWMWERQYSVVKIARHGKGRPTFESLLNHKALLGILGPVSTSQSKLPYRFCLEQNMKNRTL